MFVISYPGWVGIFPLFTILVIGADSRLVRIIRVVALIRATISEAWPHYEIGALPILDTQTQGPMVEISNLASGDFKSCFGTEN